MAAKRLYVIKAVGRDLISLTRTDTPASLILIELATARGSHHSLGTYCAPSGVFSVRCFAVSRRIRMASPAEKQY
ncbi:hypothetical protein GJAV_G00209550 [Gymnothorax javanicus]|nr:hypothetical protein GJAV_G00209550 [Gymnothorax javanicus]